METATHHQGGHRARQSLATQILIILAIILTLLAIGSLLMKVYLVHPASRDVKSKQFQALFLTNGQVYFGKVSDLDNNYVKLTNIYYLQTQPAQPGAGANASQQQQQLSLAKLGNELHGPEDVMYVAKSQVLFWENLKDDGKVVKAIKDYQTSQNK